MIETIAGIAFALLLICASRQGAFESWLYTLSLPLLPAIYMVFGLFSEGENVVLREFYAGVPYIALGLLVALRPFRWSAYAVAFLWFVHAFYDLYHDLFFINSGVFAWYPLFCAAVDVVIAAYIVWQARHWPDANIGKSVSRPVARPART